MAESVLLLNLLAMCYVLSQNATKPVVHIVVMESTGVQDNGTTFYVRYLNHLLKLALEDSRTMFGDFIDIKFKHVETLSGLTQIGALAADVYYKDKVDVFIGPATNDGAVTLGFMALQWNLPVLTPRGNDLRLRNITFFPNVVALHPFDKVELTRFIMRLFQQYDWRHISIFVDQDKTVMTSTAKIINIFCTDSGLNCFQHILSCFGCPEIKKHLIESKGSSRINLLFMDISDVRLLLIQASSLAMLDSDYVYIVPDIEGFGHNKNEIWRNDDSYDEIMKEAFRRVMLIIIQTPSHEAFDPILVRLNREMFGNDTTQYVTATFDDESETDTNQTDIRAQQYILSGYYYAIFMYLTAVNETIALGGNITDGRALVNRMCNRTYLAGKSAEFHISDQANRVVDMSIEDMTDEQLGLFQKIGEFKVLTETLVFTSEEYEHGWPSDGEYIYDLPPCGYLGQMCIPSEVNLQTALISSFIIVVVMIAVAAGVVFRLRYVQRIKNLYWWRIEPEELHSMKIQIARSVLSTSIQQNSVNTSDTVASNRELILGLFKGQLTQMHTLSNFHVTVNAGLLEEFEKIRDMNHPNVLRILGACLEGEKKVIVTEYCQKGTLKDLLMDSNFKLDVVFSLCILSDIIKALEYIHKHPLRVHGRLTSDVCMIDSRFSIKVGHYGLPSIYGSANPKNNIWVAPELLSCPGRATQKGDVYSLAIIMSEILTREDPDTDNHDQMTSNAVLSKSKVYNESPLSSRELMSKESIVIKNMMKECLARDPNKRPSLQIILSTMHALMLKTNQSGSLVDNLLQRLEKYSSNLEKIVDEKVSELRQEKHKSEELLRQMLPAPVVDRLKSGLQVEPEFYDCVTIYFSDIVGFTDICSILEPVQIVKMLNNLYTCFDEIIGNFDVYKVETIGDAYMVVSGLPTRNGNEHARQIARMSLVLLTAVSNLEPLNTPTQDRIKLRIGLNSGPVCAGVVGHKMPRYCLFGDAVNIASRMESNGKEMKIHISCSTAQILETFGTFSLNSRGLVNIKGKGTMETFWLIGETNQK